LTRGTETAAVNVQILQIVQRDGATERVTHHALNFEGMDDAGFFRHRMRHRNADEADIGAGIDDHAVLRQRVDQLEDVLQFGFDVRPPGLDQRLRLISAVAIDDEGSVHGLDHRKISEAHEGLQQ
jgi:hypothetical protein